VPQKGEFTIKKASGEANQKRRERKKTIWSTGAKTLVQSDGLAIQSKHRKQVGKNPGTKNKKGGGRKKRK